MLYPNWLDGTLTWTQIVAPHNEHRIVLTRLADLALFSVSGGWNPWTQMLFNAALHAATAAGLAAMFWPALDRAGRTIFVAVLAVVFAGTSGWQNALWGFQSQVYFANLLTLGAIAGATSSPLSRGWWWGWLAALLALFANASGWLASITLFALDGGTMLRTPNRQAWRGFWPLTLLVLAGYLVQVRAPQHQSLHARDFEQFVTVFFRCLAWPHVTHGLLAVLMQLPLAWWLVDLWRSGKTAEPADRWILALGLFAGLHAASVAYTRGAGLPEDRPLSRYQDPLLLGLAAQACAGIVLAQRHGLLARLALLAWLAALAFGLVALTEFNLTLNLPYKRAHDAASLANIRDYVRTGDATVLNRKFGFAEPPEDPAVMRRVLDDPRVRRTLPAALYATDLINVNRPPFVVRYSPWLTTIAGVALALAIAVAPRRRLRPFG